MEPLATINCGHCEKPLNIYKKGVTMHDSCKKNIYGKSKLRNGLITEEQREKNNQRSKDWYKENKEKHRQYMIKSYHKNKKKWNIRSATKIDKVKCGKCESKEHLETHHKSYENTKDVEVLCMPCHRRLHRLENQK